MLGLVRDRSAGGAGPGRREIKAWPEPQAQFDTTISPVIDLPSEVKMKCCAILCEAVRLSCGQSMESRPTKLQDPVVLKV